MLFFNKNKKKKLDDNKVNTLYERYLDNSVEYVNYARMLTASLFPDKEFDEQNAKEYYNSVNYYVTYMREIFCDEILCFEEKLGINVSDMLEKADTITKYMMIEPKYPEIIYILNDTRAPHFHTNGKYILDAEFINAIPGLDSKLRQTKINGIFEGMDILEARALLNQMRLLPINSSLDKTIKEHEASTQVFESFKESVICLLLCSGTKSDLIRARMFADTFGVDFDFSPYEEKLNGEKILSKGMKEST